MKNKTLKTKNWFRTLLCGTLAFAGITGYAQQDSLYTKRLDEVIIQNNRLQIPYAKQNHAITVLDRKMIQAMPVHSVNDLLNYVAGIDVRERGVMGAQADIGINGGTFDETLILLNGVKIIDPETGHLMMNLPFNLSDVQRIEILKGPAASAYGVNAINGAINIVTRQPNKTGVTAHLYTGSSFKRDTVNNHVYAGLGVEASASVTTEKTKQYLSIGTVQSNGYRHNTDIDTKKIFYTNKLQVRKGSAIDMMAGYISNDFGANGFFAAPVDVESKEKVQTTLAAIKGTIKLSDAWTLRPGVSYRYNFDHYILDRFHPEKYENKHYMNSIDVTINNTVKTSFGVLGFGIAYRNDAITSNSLGKHSRNNWGVFGNYGLHFLEKMSVNAGVYANYNPDYGWDIMPSVDVGYQLTKQLRIYANAGTGMRLPTYIDLYYVGPVNKGYVGIKPEKSWQASLGTKYNTGRLRVTAEYFFRQTNDFIDWVKNNLDDPWQSRNYTRVDMNGIALTANYVLLPYSQASRVGLKAKLAYTYLNPKTEGSGSYTYSHYALDNLKHQLTGTFNIQFLNRFNLTIGGTYEKRVTGKDYLLLATRLSARFKAFEVYADIDNLTNVNYVEAGAVPLPGRWVSVGLKWHWWKS